MYTSLEIRNFRCFRKFAVDSLERINLIGGLNNVGKTTLLEALFIHCGRYSAELALRLGVFRGIEYANLKPDPSREAPWDSLFADFDTMKEVQIVGRMKEGDEARVRLKALREPRDLAGVKASNEHGSAREPGEPESALPSTGVAQVLELRYEGGEKAGKHHLVLDQQGIHLASIPPPPPFPAFFQAARSRAPLKDEAERFGRLEVSNRQNILVGALKLIEPRLRRLATVAVRGQSLIYGDIDAGHLIPLLTMGGGMTRLASLVLHIANAENGVVLIDEMENGLHHSVLQKVWEVVGKLAREFNTQVFATTHSWECIVAAEKAFQKSRPYDFRFLRLERIGEEIRPVAYDRETLAAAIETGMEVR